jgi:predicted XRE-type DNA-binding protein
MKQNNSSEKNLAKTFRVHLSQHDMSVKDAAAILNISYVHLTAMLNGVRRFSGLAQEKQKRIAKFLGISKSQFFVLCGMLSPKDLLQNNSTDRLYETLQRIQSDPKLRTFVPSQADINKASEPVKVLLAVLFERVMSNSLQARLTEVEVAA